MMAEGPPPVEGETTSAPTPGDLVSACVHHYGTVSASRARGGQSSSLSIQRQVHSCVKVWAPGTDEEVGEGVSTSPRASVPSTCDNWSHHSQASKDRVGTVATERWSMLVLDLHGTPCQTAPRPHPIPATPAPLHLSSLLCSWGQALFRGSWQAAHVCSKAVTPASADSTHNTASRMWGT